MENADSSAVENTWAQPDAVLRVLSKLDATPSDLYRPARISRHMKLQVDAAGHERQTQSRELLRGGPGVARRMIKMLRCKSLPLPPTVLAAEGCRLERFMADTATFTCAFEFALNRPLREGELAMVETTIRNPPGQDDQFTAWRLRQHVREFVVQVDFDPGRLPARCVYYHQPSAGDPPQTVEERVSPEGCASFQFATIDPVPGIYGVRWDWP
ncbi:MAG: hypothetical protein GEU94_06350 [Micromonosporaceae bacterium]|nr:hypothetical protein [Micromonosporaceae bacterium]